MRDTFTGDTIVAVTAQTPSWRVKDVARYWGVTEYAVYKWVADGKLPVHKTPGGRLRFIESEVKEAKEAAERG